MTGVAGCLLAAQVGVPRAITFQTQDSLTLAATALIGGIFSLWGAVVAGIFKQLVPFLFQAQWGINPNLAADPLRRRAAPGAADRARRARGPAARRTSRKLGRLVGRPLPRAAAARGEGAVIEVQDLTVRFAGVTPIDDMSVVFPGGTCGLIGPNGAGKTTFFNVLSGFVRPAAGLDRGVRRGPARDGRLPARALGPAADVPDRAGDREALGLRQRRDDPRALGRGARLAARRRARRDRVRRARRVARRRRSAGSARASGGSSRSRAPSSASRGSSSSTSRPPAYPTRRPSISAR